jgi:tripartite-type tricarboxylate transporter receptor subunit TctC
MRAFNRRVSLKFGLLALLVAVGGLSPLADSHAQAWPSAKPIRLVIPFPPGGATDIIARQVAQRLSTSLGQQVVVDNKPGAGGAIGSDIAAKAPADGYTLLMATSSTHSIGPLLNPKTPYDTVKDFAPIVHVASAPSVLVVGQSFPANTARELVDLLKRNPGKYNYGSSGIGTYPHLSAEMFKWRAGGVFAVHIPYRGTGLVITDLVSGQISFLMDSIVSAQTHIRSGKVRPLAVTGTKRSPTLPSVPTFAEVGVPGMELVGNWFGLFAPAGAPAEVVARLNREINTMLKSPEFVEGLDKVGAEPVGGTPEEFSKTYRQEADAWRGLIQRAGIKAE